MEQYNHFTFKVPNDHDDIMQEDILHKDKHKHATSKFRNNPMTSLGSQWYHDRVRDKMKPEALAKLTGGRKKQIYRITNPFEHIIEGHEDDINGITNQYFKLKDETILSRAFYKLWEILMNFDLVNQTNPINVITLAEAPGSFIQTVIHYRKQIVGQKKDSYECITIHGEDLDENVPKMHKTFIDKYKKMLNIHPTCCLEESKKSNMDNGDLTDLKTINNFLDRIHKKKGYADFITADGGFDWDEEKYQEAEAYILLLGEIITALKVQNKDGHFVLKIFSTFTTMTIKLIMVLQSFYKEIIVTKPLMSRMSNSERYIICKTFKTRPNDKATVNKIDKLIEALHVMKKKESSGEYVCDLFPKYQLPVNILKLFRYTSMHQSNLQMIQINIMMKYLRDKNFYGEKYTQFLKKQIQANTAWTAHFYPPPNQISSALKKCAKTMTTIMAKYENDAQQFPYFVE